ncbi:MAG: ABC transporter permease [Desulfobacteraceae bacterium]|nr:MAG: ABC transporter permease [Desulfobacteraceae bacterium]
MKQYIIQRISYSLVILFFVSILIFVLGRALPGDPVQSAVMSTGMGVVSDDVIDDFKVQFGLDKPLHIQYLLWIRGFISGEWGRSIATGEEVLPMFMHRLPITLELFLGSVFWSCIIGIPFGIISALRRNSWLDVTLTTGAIIGVSIPVFWEGIIMIYLFAVIMHIFPPSGYVPFSESIQGNLLSMAMPTFIMGTQGAGLLGRYVRSSLLEVLGHDYIRTAHAKGLKERAVIVRHALKPAMIPVVTIAGLAWGYVVAGSFIVEYMFAIPGLGRMGVNAIFSNDFPVIQATLVMVAINILIVNLIVDLIYGYIDPRVRVQQ